MIASILLLLFKAAPPAHDAGFEMDARPFLARHCLGCHGAETQRSSLRFDRLDRYRAGESPLWTRIHEAVRSGTMPPEGKGRPAAEQRGRLLAWIEGRQAETRGGMRRLNRREFGAALRHATGLSVDFAHSLPGDGRLGGFDTGEAALNDAADSVEAAMRAARRAVDGLRFLEPARGEPFVADFVGARDPAKALEPWKERGATGKVRLQAKAGLGMLLEPRWVGERDVTSITLPVPKGGQGILRLRLVVWAMKPMEGLPTPRLWIEVGGRDIAFREIVGTREKPDDLVYEVQLDDLALGTKGVRVSLSNKVEIPYSVKGYENEDVARPGEEVPGGTGWFRPRYERHLPPEKKPAPTLVVQRWEVDTAHTAAWHAEGIKDDEASARKLLARWTERAWRGPATDAERERFLSLYRKLREEKLSFDDALRAAFQSVLMSSRFRYLAPARASRSALGSRLAFLLWGQPPDARLLAAADPLAEIGRLIDDPRSDGFYRPFVTQWLEMDQPITIASDHIRKQDFRFARHLKASMREETISYMAELFRTNRPAREIVESDWTMMNDALAIHYGYPGINGGAMRKVRLREGDPRSGGVLGHAGIQSMLCWMGGNWVVYRGAWAMRHLLDDPPPPPPLEVPELNPMDKANRGKTPKDLLAQHQKDANCAVCHRKMDALGFAFQSFDISGRWRAQEFESYSLKDLDGKIEWRGVGKARPVDASGRLPRGETFKGFAEARALIAKHYAADMVRGLMKNLVVVAAGRLPDVRDLAEIRRIMKAHELRGWPLRDMLTALLRSEAIFRR